MSPDTFQMIASEISLLTEAPLDSIERDTDLREIGMDSLQALQLLVAIEKHLHIKLQEEDLQQFTSVGSIMDVIESHEGAPANG